MSSESFVAALAGSYRIERELGQGGMATVYLAEDLKHHRRVAIKVLHPEIAASVGNDRFLREIDVVSRLTHPHILPLHDSGVADGLPYYVMPYVEGASLRERLSRDRQLPLDETLRLAGEIAEALEHAHRHGVVHRDIKPENILVLEDHALVMDFGIARAAQAAGPTLTTGNTVLGTPAYMSPEQWSGKGGALDGRSDLYSLACVVYEMLAGQPPFTGVTAENIAYQHMSLEPRLVSALRPAVPVAVARVLERALAKAAADRPRTAAAFAAELRAAAGPNVRATRRDRIPRPALLAGVAALLTIAILAVWLVARPRAASPGNSIAVLPLADNSDDTGQAYFAAGMTDELITCLARVSSLTVIANSASSTYRNSKKPLARIARELAVRFVLEGSVARSKGRVRIDTRLVEASTGRNVWADSYQGGLEDVLGLQGEVAIAVAQQIRARLTPTERASISAPHRVDPVAHELYLKARFATEPGTREGFQKATQLLKQALKEDPEYALAYASLAGDYYLMSGWYLPPNDAMPRVRQYADQALALDSTLTEGLTWRGMVTYFYDWKFDAGLALLRRAVDVNPGSALARQWYAYTLNSAGQYEASRAEFVRARALDPISEDLEWFAVWPWYYERRYGEAVETLNRMRARDPSYWPTYSLLGESYEALGQLPQALTALRRSRELGANQWVVAAIARVEAESGDADGARRTLHELVAGRDTAYIQPYALATVCGRLRDNDGAFRFLEESFREHSEEVTWLTIDPRIDPLRTDPRFAQFSRRLGLVN